MERIQVLINKLNDQFQQKADPMQMLVTVQLLQAELAQQQGSNKQILGTSKVAVVLPKSTAAPSFNTGDFERYGPKPAVAQPAAQPVVAEKVMETEQEVEETEYNYGKTNGNSLSNGRKKETSKLVYDPLVEIPTLSHQNGVKEINEAVASKQESLNDKLKQQSSEVGEFLKGAPIKDLRKGVGINDRFVFITELFRGDEAMYERSIKTINSFNIFPEAQYWINRELIVKLGWDVEAETVKHFYQLVRRRFS